MSRPWMPLYVTDYLLDTTDLTTEQHGVYLILLMFAWRRPGGMLPDDEKWLRSILPAMHGLTYNRLVPPLLQRFFVLSDGMWTNARLEKERRKSEEFSEKSKRNADKRWSDVRKNNELADASALLIQSQSQSQRKKGEESPNGASPRPKKLRCQLAEDWKPDARGIQLAFSHGFNPEGLLSDFSDYHRSRGNLMADWNAAWRTWVKNQVRFAKERNVNVSRSISGIL